MLLELAACLFILIAVVFVLASRIRIRQAKKQIAEMCEALEDIRNGNGNRRILSGGRELTAPLAWGINDIVVSYENRLAAFRRTEAANSRLMTSLSHDVRTPLTTLIGYLDAVHKGIAAGREREDYLENARRKAYGLKEEIDVLFDWFRLNSDELVLTADMVEAAELTRSLLIDWIPVLEEKGIGYAVDIAEQPLRARLDPDAYMRILNNLIQNVIAHSHADQIRISLSGQDGRLRILVADNGVGIGKEDLKYIFDRLYQCEKGRSEGGSGLGLSIVRQLAEKMNGTISAESIQGKGTAFTLFFPLAE